MAVAAGVGILAAVSELAFGRLILPHRDIETPRRWEDGSWFSWSVKNGLALGAGFLTRVGFTLWYVAPVALFFNGDWVLGAWVMGVYGAVRGLSLVPTNGALNRLGFHRVARRLAASRRSAQRLSGTSTLVLCSGVLLWLAV